MVQRFLIFLLSQKILLLCLPSGKLQECPHCQILSPSNPITITGLALVFTISHGMAQETPALPTTWWLANLPGMFDLWVWVSSGALPGLTDKFLPMLAGVLWPPEYLQGMESIKAGMKEVLNCAERDNREIICQLQSPRNTKERQKFKHKFPFGFSYDNRLPK